MNRKLLPCALLLLASLPQAGADSLYKPGSYQSLTSDLRMRKAGDLITVLVYESASASSTANTSVGRGASVGLDLQGTGAGMNYAAGIDAANQTDGRGRTQREGKVLAQITVAIKTVTANGDLVIAGEQLLDINNERQQIRIEGRIRPQDVSDTNVVLSTRIAGAKISYSGQGDLADKQRPAWWQRFLTLFGV